MSNKRFDTMKNGYNHYQVDDAMSILQEHIEIQNKKISLYQNEYEALAQQLKACRRQLEIISQDLASKEKAANQMTARVLKEANLVIGCAQKNADVIVKEALMTARGILLDISRIGKDASDVKGSMEKDLKQIQYALDNFQTPNIPDVKLLK